MKKTTTLLVLYALAVVAACWEMWTICNDEPGDTFSATVKKLGSGQPFIIFMCGMLSGHLWWPLRDGED